MYRMLARAVTHAMCTVLTPSGTPRVQAVRRRQGCAAAAFDAPAGTHACTRTCACVRACRRLWGPTCFAAAWRSRTWYHSTAGTHYACCRMLVPAGSLQPGPAAAFAARRVTLLGAGHWCARAAAPGRADRCCPPPLRRPRRLKYRQGVIGVVRRAHESGAGVFPRRADGPVHCLERGNSGCWRPKPRLMLLGCDWWRADGGGGSSRRQGGGARSISLPKKRKVYAIISTAPCAPMRAPAALPPRPYAGRSQGSCFGGGRGANHVRGSAARARVARPPPTRALSPVRRPLLTVSSCSGWSAGAWLLPLITDEEVACTHETGVRPTRLRLNRAAAAGGSPRPNRVQLDSRQRQPAAPFPPSA